LNVHKKQLEKQLLCRSRHIRKIFALEGSELYGHVLFCFIDVFPNTNYAFFTYKVPNSGGCLVFSIMIRLQNELQLLNYNYDAKSCDMIFIKVNNPI